MNLSLGYGRGKVALNLPDRNIQAVMAPNEVASAVTGEAAVRASLENPIGSARLCEIAKPGQRVVIVTSDITRPVPSYKIIPAILDELAQAGVPDGDITVIFGLGSHRAHTEADMRALVGDAVYDRVRCEDSTPDDCVRMGMTSRGTPVDISRTVAQADLRVCVGNIEYHYFAGYSGGAKAIMPGVSTREAIQKNHSRMVEPGAAAGRLEGNPVREDIDEAAQLCPAHFIVNVVLNESKEIVYCASGHHIAAHREGCRFLDRLYSVELSAPADLVIASAGGFPKDINLYQAQKGLDNATHAVRQGGIIILLAECAEGLGEEVFKHWMEEKNPADMIGDIREHFVLGGHKAAAIALTMGKARVFLVSAFVPGQVRAMHMTPFDRLDTAVNAAFEQLGDDLKAVVMPYSGSTLPKIIGA